MLLATRRSVISSLLRTRFIPENDRTFSANDLERALTHARQKISLCILPSLRKDLGETFKLRGVKTLLSHAI